MEDHEYFLFTDDFAVLMESTPPLIHSFRSLYQMPLKRKRSDTSGFQLSRFPTAPLSEFICGLCTNVVKKPVECKKCGKLYCETCATMLKKNPEQKNSKNFTCSICGSFQEPRQPSLLLVRIIGELKMKCTNDDKGCHGLVAINDMTKHELSCPFREVSCENSRFCHKSGLLKDYIESEGFFRNSYSHFSARNSLRQKCYTCSEDCKKMMLFEKKLMEKQPQKALADYYEVLKKIKDLKESVIIS